MPIMSPIIAITRSSILILLRSLADVFCACSRLRLDIILGKVGSKAIDAYESKMSLASRIVKVERTVMSRFWLRSNLFA